MSHVREPDDLPAGRIRRHAGETMTEQILAEFWWVDNRTLRRPSTQM